ncbi:MAG: cytochrome ubiquinol oxidase subunit I [Flavisolibacter sp.]|nr:cytochrome ubiquinol oxidase subunit I [Flavisolibacter sp.]
MDDLFAARLQMVISLGFHIFFTYIGITMPILITFSGWKWLRTKKQEYVDIAKAWSKGVAVFFAVGAVSGTVLEQP